MYDDLMEKDPKMQQLFADTMQKPTQEAMQKVKLKHYAKRLLE